MYLIESRTDRSKENIVKVRLLFVRPATLCGDDGGPKAIEDLQPAMSPTQGDPSKKLSR